MADRTIDGFPKALDTVLVEQEAEGDERTAVDIVAAAELQQSELKKRIQALEAEQVDGRFDEEQGAQYAQLMDELALAMETEGDVRERAVEVLKQLGFKRKTREQPSKELSGGWKMRISLACAIFRKPDLLLLDEPVSACSAHVRKWRT